MSLTVTRNDTEPSLVDIATIAGGDAVAVGSTAYIVLVAAIGGPATLWNPADNSTSQHAVGTLVLPLAAEITFSNPA